MECLVCGSEKPLQESIVKKYKYTECGLDNVILNEVKKSQCEQCGEVYYNFGNLELLHKFIGKMLISKSGTLTGKELRFLRKQLGYTSAMFARLVGYEAEHLSRIENGHSPVQEVFDRLVRHEVANKFPDRQYNLHDIFLKGEGLTFSWLNLAFSEDTKEWKLLEAA